MTTSLDESLLPPFFLYGFAAGFLGCVICFGFTRTVLIPKLSTDSFRERFQSLSTIDACNLYSLGPSTVHALVQVLFHPAWISLGFSLAHSEDTVNYFDDIWPAFFSGVFVGYLLGDFAMLGPKALGVIFSIHHLSASAAWILSNHLRTMQYYMSFLQFCEFSTLFLNYRQVVLTAGYPSSSSIATVASLGLFLSFSAVRILPLPGIIYQWITKDCAVLHEAHGMTVAAANTVFLTIHVGLQSLWFSVMVKKLLAFVSGKPSKQKKEE